MLLSELEERKRRFKLALRAGIPLLLLFSLVFYTIFLKDDTINLTIGNTFLLVSIIFTTIYFIYFLLEEDPKESLLDQTTHGFNQKTFIKKFKARKPKTLALLIIKNLTTINENYGSRDIDSLLHTIIHRLNNKFKELGEKKPLIGRQYGAEFLIAIDKNSEEVEDILRLFSEENKSINSIEIDYSFATIQNTQENIDKAIIQLKDTIKSKEADTPDDPKESIIKDAQEFSKLEENVISAIKKESLILSFRPLLNTHSNKIDIYEIAVKLKIEGSNDILPRVYLPIVNRLGLGREYDLILIKHIIDLLPLIDSTISLTFNLSPFSLRDSSFQEKFFNYLNQTNINPSRLIIQLYERKTHHNLSGYLETLKNMRARGLRVCIDNFGSSNASMEYMKHFKFDMIQFDRDYVTNLNDETSYAMLESLTKMSKDLHILTVAKWVDKDEQKERLRALGIDYLQGFGIGKPLQERDLIEKYN